jgi:hypothetical protein
MRPDWKIYYADGTTYNSLDGGPDQAPAIGVQVIIQRDKNHGIKYVSGGDYYLWDDRGEGAEWWAADEAGLILYIIEPGIKVIKLGTHITPSRFSEIIGAAKSDPDFPPKTGQYRHERIA